MPMITSGWPREPKSAQLVAGRNQSSPFAFNKHPGIYLRPNRNGDPDNVIAFAMVCEPELERRHVCVYARTYPFDDARDQPDVEAKQRYRGQRATGARQLFAGAAQVIR